MGSTTRGEEAVAEVAVGRGPEALCANRLPGREGRFGKAWVSFSAEDG